jgi:hypothetical protein
MGIQMSTEIFFLTLTVGMTGLFWVPYILGFATRGIMATLGYLDAKMPPQSDWAERMRLAHNNTVENLAIFAPLEPSGRHLQKKLASRSQLRALSPPSRNLTEPAMCFPPQNAAPPPLLA